jgi:putative endonuclease
MGPGRTGTLGKQAEQEALGFLLRRGLTLIEENFQTRGGEIDLILLHDDCLVFVEVRSRTSIRFSSPELTVDSRKQLKIIRTAAMFIAANRRFARHTVRFDVVAISAGRTDGIRWLQDAFRPADSVL